MIDPIIIDDCVSKPLQDHIETMFTSDGSCPWYYNTETTLITDTSSESWKSLNKSVDNTISASQFTHNLMENGESVSTFSPILIQLCSALPFTLDKIIRAKANFKIANGSYPENCKDIPHIDHVNEDRIPFVSILYYVNDADGDTYLYDQEYVSGEINIGLQPKKVISPKKGRMVIFDGYNLHSAGIPRNKNRAVINIAATIMEKT